MRARWTAVVAAALLCSTLTACGSAHPREAAAVAEPVSATRTLAAMPIPLRLQPPEGFAVVDLKPGLATYRATVRSEDAIRIMTPRTVGAPRGGERAAPADLHRYLTSQAPYGVRITEDRPIDLSGTQGRLFTVTTTRTVPSGLGCWSGSPDACFDIPPGLRLRVATFTVHDRPVILWARTSAAHPSTELVLTFERMLATVRFGA